MMTDWTPDSWRNHPIRQVPAYPDTTQLTAMEAKLRGIGADIERTK